MPTLRQLRYLVALGDTQNFRRAADQVHVTQPTLSLQMRKLEESLGVKLAERERPVLLTPIGRDIAERARNVLTEVEEIRAAASRHKQGLAGTIRFGVTPTLGPYLMPSAIVRLHRENPDLHLYVREGIPDELIDQLRRGELDMVLTPLPVSASDLHVEPLFAESLALVAAPDHPLFDRKALNPRDFDGQPVLSLDRRHHFHRQAEEICAELGANLQRDYEGTSLDSLRQMAGSGLGIAILPELYLRSEAGGEDMVRRFVISGWSAQRHIAAAWRNKAAYGDAFALIAEMVAAEAREMLA